MMAKKQWQAPKLISLVRHDPQEAVLSACKTYIAGGTGSQGVDSGCWYHFDGPSSCGNCAALPTS